MSAATMAGQLKPSVAYTADAIKAGIAHEAANGPSHVRIKALGMMARITGLYDQARYEAKLAFEAARKAAQDMTEQVKDAAKSVWDTVGQELEDIRTGRTIVTAETLGKYAPAAAAAEAEAEDEEEEDGSANDSEDPP